jgi:hypothetical protein
MGLDLLKEIVYNVERSVEKLWKTT